MPKTPRIPPSPICYYENISMEKCSCNDCINYQKINGYIVAIRKVWYIRIYKWLFE